MSSSNYGISGISLFVPPYRVSLRDWCQWTGNPWDKISAVIGHSFRVPGAEDNVYTMAAEAVLKLILDYDVDPQRIGHLALCTESSTDNAIGGVIVRGLVDEALVAHGKKPLARACEVPEYKQACLSGVYGIKGAMRYLAFDAGDRQAIVVSADIAEYARGSTGEPTQGAGAVATLIEAEPRLLALDLHRSGSASSYRIADFRKPFLRFCGQQPEANDRLRDFPVFNGKYSTACYIDEVVCAFADHFHRRGGARADYLRQLGAVFMHRPYHHMPVAAWSTAYLSALAADGGAEHEELAAYCAEAEVDLQEMVAEIQTSPVLNAQEIDGPLPAEAYPLTARVVRAFQRSDAAKAIVRGKLALGAGRMMHMGNLYTAALPAWLAAGLEEAAGSAAGDDIEGRDLLLVGYGSGDAAEVIGARLAPGWREAAARIRLDRALSAAVDLDETNYQRLHSGRGAKGIALPERAGFVVSGIGSSSSGQRHDAGIAYYDYRLPATGRDRRADAVS